MLSTGHMREPMFALIGAKSEHSGEPVAAAAVNPADMRETGAGLALIECPKASKNVERSQLLLENDALKEKLTLIIYHNAEEVGSFGEKQVLTSEDRELRRFALLGTEEGDAVLNEFTLSASSKRGMGAALADGDEEEDDM